MVIGAIRSGTGPRRQQVAAPFAARDHAGLLSPDPDAEAAAPWPDDWVIPAPAATAAGAATGSVELAAPPMGLRINDAALGVGLELHHAFLS